MGNYPVRPEFRVAVFVIVRDADGKILLQERAGTEYLPGYYDLPSGHVEHGEPLTAAAARELQEETGLEVTEQDLEFVFMTTNQLEYSYVDVVFLAKRWAGLPKIGEPNKCTNIRFFDVKNLPPKQTLVVRQLERVGFMSVKTTPHIDLESYEQLMGEPFKLV